MLEAAFIRRNCSYVVSSMDGMNKNGYYRQIDGHSCRLDVIGELRKMGKVSSLVPDMCWRTYRENIAEIIRDECNRMYASAVASDEMVNGGIVDEFLVMPSLRSLRGVWNGGDVWSV